MDQKVYGSAVDGEQEPGVVLTCPVEWYTT